MAVLRPPTPTLPATEPAPPPRPTVTPRPATATPTPVRSWQDALVHQRNGNYAQAIADYQVLLARQPDADDEVHILYHLAETYLLDRRYPEAVETFDRLLALDPEGDLAARARFLRGAAHHAWGDALATEGGEQPPAAVEHWKAALADYRAYRAAQDLVDDVVSLRMGELLAKLGRYREALTVYERAAANEVAPAGLQVAALQGLGEAYQRLEEYEAAADACERAYALATDPAQKAARGYAAAGVYQAWGRDEMAVRWWRAVALQYPRTPEAYRAVLGLTAAGDDSLSFFQKGMVYYYNADYEAAVTAFHAHADTDPAHDGAAHYYAGLARQRQNRHTQAIAEFQVLIRTHPADPLFDDAWLAIAESRQAMGDLRGAIQTYLTFARLYPAWEQADQAIYRAADLMAQAANCRPAITLYLQVSQGYPAGRYADQARFQAGLCHYRLREYADAIATWEPLIGRGDSGVQAQALFWIGKAALELGDEDRAQADLSRAAELAPDSYYGLRAGELLDDLARLSSPGAEDGDQDAFEEWLLGWTHQTADDLRSAEEHLRASPRLRRAVELLALNLRGEAEDELRLLRAEAWDDPLALYRLALALHDLGFHALAISCAERIAALSPAGSIAGTPAYLQQLAYPRAYADLVEPQAASHGVDPLLFYALIRQESRFEPTATSRAAARGLTQVIPSTGQFIARKLGLTDFQVDDLYRPYVSVLFGVTYLAAQLEAFDGSVPLALAAYNGGPTNARRWRQASDDVDVAVETIHLAETARYVRAVIEQHARYRALYPVPSETAKRKP